MLTVFNTLITFTFFNMLSIFEKFEPMNFIKNFSYVGAGMLGIFIVIGIIIVSIMILNSLTKKKTKK